MAASMTFRKASCPRSAASQRTSVMVHAQPVQPKAVSKLMSGVATAGLAASLLLSNISPAHAELASLADVTRPDFAFVDANKDGIVTKAEISEMSKVIAQEQEFDAPGDDLVDFTARVFDLNQDGQLTTDEMLSALALDSAVSEEYVNPDVIKVMDRDGNGEVTLAEWKSSLGNLGPLGEQVKEYVFKRTDYLTDRDQSLDVNELGNALTLMRILVLGY